MPLCPYQFSYTLNGTVVSQTSITDPTTQYGVLNRRTHEQTPQGAVNYTYDAAGRRMSKTIGANTTQFLYDGLNPVQELSGSSSPTVTANMLTGLSVDEYFSRTDASGTSALLADALVSTIGLVNSSSSIATGYTYEPFRNATASGAASGNPFQFTGRENDGTGLYFYRARYYSPMFQRFVSQDPIGFAGGDYNLYGYVLHNPVIFSNPTGNSLANCLRQLAELGRILNRLRNRSQERQNVPTSCQDTGHKKAVDQTGNQMPKQAARAKNACAPYLQQLAEVELILEEAEDLLALP